MDFWLSQDNIIVNDNSFTLYATSGFIKPTEKLKNDIKKHDCKIHFDGKYYYLISPYEKAIKPKKETSWCSIDPGVRKFLTCYSFEKDTVNIIGDRASSKLHKNLIALDKTISENSLKPSKKLHNKKIYLLNKIKNLQQELHRKTSKFLCDNYTDIIIPKLTKENDIINSKKCKLKTKTVRQMTVLGHCKFIEMLKTKAKSYENTQIHDITEEYTSQTCISCSKRTKTSLETFKCKHCFHEIDRDVMGSINIFLKFMNLM